MNSFRTPLLAMSSLLSAGLLLLLFSLTPFSARAGGQRPGRPRPFAPPVNRTPMAATTAPAELPREAARVVDAFGTVERKPAGSETYTAVREGDLLQPQTVLRTGDGSAALLLLPGGHHFRVGEKSVVQLNELGKDKQFAFKVLSGQVWSLVRKFDRPAKFEVTTPSAVAGVSGTLFAVGYELESDLTTVSTGEGLVNVSLTSGSWQGAVPAGQYIPFLRRPQPNIRLRAPEIIKQGREQAAMWGLLRKEGWTRRDLTPNGPRPRLLRKNEGLLRRYLRLPTIQDGERPGRSAGEKR